jgi:hypothetical protein
MTGIVFLVGAVLVLVLIVAYAMWPSSHTGGSSATTGVVQPSPD